MVTAFIKCAEIKNIIMNQKFFLGGNDLEMSEIKKILSENGIPFEDKNLRWGASASAYAEEIKKSIDNGFTPVLVELKNDISEDLFAKCQIIDHHDAYVGRSASVMQVLDLLNLQPTRQQLLIAANDSGYIPAMLAIGASRSEVEEIRRMDWQAQGISQDLVAEAMKAYETKKIINGVYVIEMEHFCFAPVTDTAFWDQPQQNILFRFREGRTLYFGKSELVGKVYDKFQNYGCWRGGNFVGCPKIEFQDEITKFILENQ